MTAARLPGASARWRIPALEGDSGLAAMFDPAAPDERQARVSDGIRCVGALALDTRRQQEPLLAGLSLTARLAARVRALGVWGEVAGDVALDEGDDQYRANRQALFGVLAGLLPGLDLGQHGGPLPLCELEVAEEELTAAGKRVARLAAHEALGTHPEYLPGDVSVQDAMAADQTHAAWELQDLACEWAGKWDGGQKR